MLRESLLPRIALMLCLLPAPAMAQGMDTDLARRYYKLGEDLYNRADYEEALKQFKKSYLHSKKPALLYNIGRCEESLGHWDKAIEMYQQYLTISPPNANMIKARIINLRRLIQKKEASQRPAAPASQPVATPASQPAPTPAPTPAAPPPVKVEKPEPEPEPEPRPEPKPEPEPRSRAMRIAGWTLVGVGGAALVAGIFLGTASSAAASDLEQAWERGDSWEKWRDTVSEGETYEAAAVLSWIIGGALAATGATLVIVDYLRRPKDSQRRVWITPGITSAGPAVSAGLRF